MATEARRLRKVRRKIHRGFPAASADRVAAVDPRLSFAALAAQFAAGDSGVDGAGAALALWRALTDKGWRAWCCEFGFAGSVSHHLVVVETRHGLRVHDPLFNSDFVGDLDRIIDALRAGRLPPVRRDWRDRRIYLADPAVESDAVLRWLAAHADCEHPPAAGLRRFALLWTEAAQAVISPVAEAARCELAARGYPADLRFLLLHPLGVFDGAAMHRDPATMPLFAGRDLGAPFAALAIAERQLAAALAKHHELSARAARLDAAQGWAVQQREVSERRRAAAEAKLADSAAALAAKTAEAETLTSRVAQLHAALDDGGRQAQADAAAARLARDRGAVAWVAERAALIAAADRSAGEAAALRREAAALRRRVEMADRSANRFAAELANRDAALAELREGAALRSDLVAAPVAAAAARPGGLRQWLRSFALPGAAGWPARTPRLPRRPPLPAQSRGAAQR